MFNGKGRNGKSKLLSLMQNFVGSHNTTNFSLQALEEKFTIGNLYTKLLNIGSDLSKQSLKNTSNFKSLTGRDTMPGDRKFKSTIYFENYAKMVFAANEPPYTYDDTEGFWSRWIMIDFIYKFVPNPTEPHHKLENPNILEDIMSPREMSGLLNWALEGLDRLFKNKRFSTNTSTEKGRQKWKAKSSSFESFLEEEVVYEFKGEINHSYLMENYIKYCRINKLKPESQRVIKLKLEEYGSYQVRRYSTEYFWKDIKFSNEELNNQVEEVDEL
jgi:putative DNA primase/helicase